VAPLIPEILVMGSLDDPRLRDIHDQITQAIQWSSRPNFQRVAELLNGMSMDDMLDEIYRIKATGYLDQLASFAGNAQGVNNNRLRAALGAYQDNPPADMESLVNALPSDQQGAINRVRGVSTGPPTPSPTLWPGAYSKLRLLPTYVPPPAPAKSDAKDDDSKGSGDSKGDDDDDEAHLAADVASGLTANAPKGANSATYTVTAIYRNLDYKKYGNPNNEVAILHEPNFSVQVSPDPGSPAAVQAAVTLINLHLKRNWGLVKPDIEASLAAQGGVSSTGAPSGSAQAQVEVHVTTKISLTLSSSLGVGPPLKPGDPPDNGAFHFGNRNADLSFTPFSIGILGHWDPVKPKKK
jgi:hypothetical protein